MFGIQSLLIGTGDLNSIALDFGSGSNPRNPFAAKRLLTIDLVDSDLSENHSKLEKPGDPIPFDNDYFDRVSAYDVLEHLSRDTYQNHFIFYMNEFYRVLKPGGIALFVFPCYPHEDAISDPTHVNLITKRTIDYFLGIQKGNYAGIYSSWNLLVNKKVRIRKHFDPIYKLNESPGLRRKLSLLKRDFVNIMKPSHRVWILQK